MALLPDPNSTACLSRFRSFRHGVSTEKPYSLATEPSRRSKYWLRNPAQGASAPSEIGRSSSGTTSSGSTSKLVPSPSQRSHAPYGELNEKFRGASSSNDNPQYVHARCSEKVSTSRSSSCSFSPSRGTISTSATPSSNPNPVSTQSVSPRPMP